MRVLQVRTYAIIQVALFLLMIGSCPRLVCGQQAPGAHNEADTYYARGLALYRSGRYKEAVESFGRAVTYKPADAEQLYSMSLAHLQLGRYLEAVLLLEASIKLQPKHAASLAVLGALHTYFGRYVEAENALKEVISLGDPTAEVLNNLGVAYYRGGRNQQAVEAFIRAARLAPAEAVIYHNMGNAHLKLGQTAEAYKAKRRAELLGHRNISDSGVILLLNGLLNLESQRRVNPAEVAKASDAENTGPSDEVRSSDSDSGQGVGDKTLTEVYRVGVGDVLDIKLKGASSAGSTLYTVLAGGLLEYPPLGEPLAVAGKTTDEISRVLESELRRRGVGPVPSVFVNTREYVSHTIFVSGSVESRGVKVLRREAVPLYVILAEAQPLRDACRVILNSYATGKVAEVQLAELNRESVLIGPGDVVKVEPCEQEFFFISGKVTQPGEKRFRRGLTLTQAVVSSGGLLRANRFCIISRQRGDGKLITLRYDLRHLTAGIIADPILQAGDRVEVF